MRTIEAWTSKVTELYLMPITAITQQENLIKTEVNDTVEIGKRKNVDEPSAMHQTVAPVYGEDIRRIPFSFNGKGFEYFKIWIVNILLSIVTLGIYSAWAKVRSKQYFYGNTLLDNASFEYTAEPFKILKGRLIAVVFCIVYFFIAKTSPMIAAAMGLLLIVFIPWIIVSSLKFNARHSSYRNINFRFVGTIGEAAKYFLLWPLLAIITLGILLPFVWKKQTTYITTNHLYGNQFFTFRVEAKEYYKILLILIGCGIIVGIIIKFVFSSLFSGLTVGSPVNIVEGVPAFIACAAIYLIVTAYFVAVMANIHNNNTQLYQHRFVSTWSAGSYALLLFTNALGVLLTLGLFIPFAKVRSATYKAAHLALVASGGMMDFIAAEQEQSNALGKGVHDIFNIDIGL